MNMNETDLARMNGVLRHSLRNFASGIKTSMSILASEAEGLMPRNCMEYFPLITNECDRLDIITKRMNFIFDPLASGSSGNMGEVLEKVMAEIHASFPMAQISLEPGANVHEAMVSDAGLLRVVLLEVLRNAVEADGKKEVSLACAVEEGELRCCVGDQGPGVPDDDYEKIFMPFYTTRSSHIGIGLTIAKRIINKMRSEIMARQNNGGGLAIEFSVPVVSGKESII